MQTVKQVLIQAKNDEEITMFANVTYRFFTDDSGQGITEYGAVLAFVAFLMVAVFAAGQSTFATAIKGPFSSTANTLNHLTTNGP